MDLKNIVEDLPEIYAAFLPEQLQEPLPRESFATCGDCPMCLKEGQEPEPNVRYFSPDSKCCTFHPSLPNYLVGGLLSDENPALEEGRWRIREKIGMRTGVTPHGVLAPRKYSLLYKTGGPGNFGKTSSLLCPYFDRRNGRCSVWRFREAVCCTYFCRSIAGRHGKVFWETFKLYLLQIQDALIKYALYELGLEPVQILENAEEEGPLSAEEVDELPPSEAEYSQHWGDWIGREEELFRRTFEIVGELTPQRFEEATGITQKVLLAQVSKMRGEMVMPHVPERLKVNGNLEFKQLDEKTFALVADTGPLTVVKNIFELLPLFDGTRTVQQVRQIVWEHGKVKVADDVFAMLYQHGVLVGAGGELLQLRLV